MIYHHSSTAPESRPARLPYLPALDGLRALAVIGVLLYHADLNIRGGFLGVETFFVLSGFLITALLLAEWRQHGRVDLLAFWLRRARRLLPALFGMLLGVLLIAATLLRGEAGGLGGDLASALGYVMNWHLVASQQSYFDPLVRPSLLQHLWSLAVEEQFYLLWPLLFVAGMRYLRVRGLLLVALAVAGASAALMAWIFEPGVDPSRIYYGTDTRASALVLGAALAFAWVPGNTPAFAGRTTGTLLDMLGGLALAGLLAAYVWLGEYHPLLYRGGFALASLATAAVIAAITSSQARVLPRLLGWRPLRWVGLRSYAIYLWHWPIFTITRPYQDVLLDGWPLLGLRLAIVLALAELSYRLIETPIRHGALDRAWHILRARWSVTRTTSRRWRLVRAPMLIMIVLSSGACVSSTSQLPAGAPTASQATLATPLPTITPIPTAIATSTAASTATSTAEPAATAATSPTPATPATETAPAVAAFDPALAERLQAILDRTVADGAIPGAVLSVSIPGQGTWAGASGIRDRKTQAPIAPDTRMRIASISKTFTAAVVLQLVEEGKIELDAPMSTWLPELVPSGDTITVRNLLQHTTGLYDYLEDRNLVNQAYRDLEHAWAPRELVEYAAKFPAAFKPGAKGAWDYSSTNYVILGMLAEQVTGQPLAAEMRARIFEPLGLESTFFTPQEPVAGVMSGGYSNSIDQTNAPMTFAFATANLVSTPDDVRRFAEALFGGQVLQPATMELMTTFVNGKGQYKMPKLEYGLGVMRNQLPVGPAPDGAARPAATTTVLGHIGGFGGFRSAVWHAPDSGITIALGVNQAATDPNLLATPVFDAILTHLGW